METITPSERTTPMSSPSTNTWTGARGRWRRARPPRRWRRARWRWRPATQELPREQEAGARDHLSGEEAFQRGFPADGGEFGQKADLTEIDAEKRNVQPGKLGGPRRRRFRRRRGSGLRRRCGPADEFFGRAVGGKGGTSHTVASSHWLTGCCGGFGRAACRALVTRSMEVTECICFQ